MSIRRSDFQIQLHADLIIIARYVTFDDKIEVAGRGWSVEDWYFASFTILQHPHLVAIRTADKNGLPFLCVKLKRQMSAREGQKT